MHGRWIVPVTWGIIATAACSAPLRAQGTGGSVVDVCALVTDEEFQRAEGVDPRIGVLTLDPPVLTEMTWGPHCDYSPGAIDLFTHKSPEAELERVLKLTEGGKQRTPVEGLGKKAFFTTIYPDDQYRNRGLIAIYVGSRILAVSMDADGIETTAATRPKLEPLAKLVLSRYKE
jgi:hypothetical protein